MVLKKQNDPCQNAMSRFARG